MSRKKRERRVDSSKSAPSHVAVIANLINAATNVVRLLLDLFNR